jgi:hypothetical protein
MVMNYETTPRPLITVDVHVAPGVHAVEAITTTGDTVLWLMVHSCEPVESHGCSCTRCAPSEQAGPLPTNIAATVARVTRRCGGVRADGGTCRIEVRGAGLRCHWHAVGES